MSIPQTTLISIHIPKTGGTTLLNILQQVYMERLQLAYNDERDVIVESPLCYHGHAVLDNFCDVLYKLPNTRWVSFLRDPLRSAISLYHYGISQGTVQEIGIHNWLTSTETFCWPNPPGYNHNRFSKWIARAKTSWDQFDIVGITEYFDQSIDLISRELNWPVIEYSSRNVGSYKSPELSDSIIEEFKRLNSNDYQIYDKAVKRLIN